MSVVELRSNNRFRVIDAIEISVLFLSLMLIFGAFTIPLGIIAGSNSRTEGNWVFQALSLALYGFGLFYLLLRPASIVENIVKNWPIWLIIGFAASSSLWSAYPDTALRRALALGLCTIFAVYVRERLSLSSFLKMFTIVLSLYLVATLISVLIPGVGIAEGRHAGTLQGISNHKNALGRIMGTSLLICAAMGLASVQGKRRAAFGLAAVCGIMLIFTQSLTSMAAAAAGLATMSAAAWLRFPIVSRRSRLSRGLAAIIILFSVSGLVTSAMALSPVIFSEMGKGETYNGRSRIWRYSKEMSAKRPWLGYGYRTFWTDAYSLPLLERMKFEGAPTRENFINHGHSSYLDTWVELGWVGVSMMGLIALSAISRAISAFRRNDMIRASLMFGLLGFMAVYSFSEKMLLEQTDLTWFLFCLFYFYAQKISPASFRRTGFAADGSASA